MNIAVLSLCRDRIDYTRYCFESLRQHAGVEYDHYVLDQASSDGTGEWLVEQDMAAVVLSPENIGIHRGHNKLLDLACDGDYDVVVTFDNDCEVVWPGTLKAAAEVAAHGDWIVSPTVEGLNFPPAPGPAQMVHGERVGLYWEIGGIFRCMPGEFAKSFRFDETRPLWGKDEVDVGAAARGRGMGVGYLLDWHVAHYETTKGQAERYPSYFERKFAEMR